MRWLLARTFEAITTTATVSATIMIPPMGNSIEFVPS
jgi:hypothetical protein